MTSARTMNLAALALLIVSLLLLVGFHFLPLEIDPDSEPGWTIWGVLVDEYRNIYRSGEKVDPELAIASVAAVTWAFLIAVSPFLLPLLRRSRWLWWIAVLLSGISLLGFSGLIIHSIVNADPLEPGPPLSVYCIIGSQILHFAGLLFIRREAGPPSAAQH